MLNQSPLSSDASAAPSAQAATAPAASTTNGAAMTSAGALPGSGGGAGAPLSRALPSGGRLMGVNLTGAPDAPRAPSWLEERELRHPRGVGQRPVALHARLR